MKRLLQIEIGCGETTCASEPGKFCPWLRMGRLGQKWHCGLFALKKLEDNPEGWLQRLPECLAAEVLKEADS